MEKLINILPNLITNADSDFLKGAIKNPDFLTQDIMKHFNATLFRYALMNVTGGVGALKEVNDDTKIDELIEMTKTNLPEEVALSDLLTEIKTRFDCSDKSASTIIWLTNIINNLEERNIDQKILKDTFVAICSKLKGSNKAIGDLFKELKETVKKEPEIVEDIDNYTSYAFLLNPQVQASDRWFNFLTLEELDMEPNMEINNDVDLIKSLKSQNNYIVALNYVKEKYLSDKDANSPGFCLDKNERDYKANIIIATLASETNKDNPNFDKDNLIGLNLTAGIIATQDKLNERHVLFGITNGFEGIEEDAGQIVGKILGRELKIKRVFDVRPFKTGDMNEYIKSHLNSFKKLIKPNIEYCFDIMTSLQKISNKYSTKKYVKDAAVKQTFDYIAKELGVELEDTKPGDWFNTNCKKLQDAAQKRYVLLNRISNIFSKVKTKQKNNIHIQDLVFDRSLLGNEEVLSDKLQEQIIKEFYKAVEEDMLDTAPLLKGDPHSKLRIKSPKMILSDMKKQVGNDTAKYPELTKLFAHYSLSRKEQITEIVDSHYVNRDGSINEEYKEVYDNLTNSKVSKDVKKEIVKSSNLPDEEKDKIDDLL